MNNLNHVLETLSEQGYQFAFFLKKQKVSTSNTKTSSQIYKPPDNFFSHIFISSPLEQTFPVPIQNLVNNDEKNVTKFRRLPKNQIQNFKHLSLNLNNKRELQSYIYNGLKLLRQVPCKTISKIWIKIIEPKKKTKFPYIKGNSTKPEWWPSDVEHREPDHLQKPDRLKLMVSILVDVLPMLQDEDILDELIRTTHALSIFKRDKAKNHVLNSMFDICRTLCNRYNKNYSCEPDTIEVIEINQLQKKPEPLQSLSAPYVKEHTLDTQSNILPIASSSTNPIKRNVNFNLQSRRQKIGSPLRHQLIVSPLVASNKKFSPLKSALIIKTPINEETGLMNQEIPTTIAQIITTEYQSPKDTKSTHSDETITVPTPMLVDLLLETDPVINGYFETLGPLTLSTIIDDQSNNQNCLPDINTDMFS
ncbi:hypothetical protein TBLA_0D04060 [Henningerozyma blattae CBS 6284]|uniref:Uncharacterized protein n=1 Tax=Henningerozyma blattae (strain ATCC 34711 / CBS 6284 / DSM 70876 / NBRC 10599 / NRRL Y-10934 / UCD 77-7) TaxID=1071380 RepID=I2H3F1_HENB6|nr:hypothetical protein TBLA_0D04060 [Tetrapisispora blattae CBS 6284]CCH60903.1 hypothetical protein TBLA_0D04060 [Tetrapisispora blattae CBS 6284]